MLEELKGGARCSGRQEVGRLTQLQEDLTAFGVATNKEGRKRVPKERRDGMPGSKWGVQRPVEGGMTDRETRRTHRLKRERDTVKEQATAKRQRADGDDKRGDTYGCSRRQDIPPDPGGEKSSQCRRLMGSEKLNGRSIRVALLKKRRVAEALQAGRWALEKAS